jgi:NADPH:quinone reductase-like Zn-dependent oxidoreductase
VNYVDVYHRTGLYPLPSLPAVPGVEAAGVVEALGPGVDTLRVGQRIAYAGLPVGGYASVRHLPAERPSRCPTMWPMTRWPACCCAASPPTCC